MKLFAMVGILVINLKEPDTNPSLVRVSVLALFFGAERGVPFGTLSGIRVVPVRPPVRPPGVRPGVVLPPGVRPPVRPPGVRPGVVLPPGVRGPGIRVPGARGPGVRDVGARVAGVRVAGVRVAGVRVPGVRVPGARVPALRVPGGLPKDGRRGLGRLSSPIRRRRLLGRRVSSPKRRRRDNVGRSLLLFGLRRSVASNVSVAIRLPGLLAAFSARETSWSPV